MTVRARLRAVLRDTADRLAHAAERDHLAALALVVVNHGHRTSETDAIQARALAKRAAAEALGHHFPHDWTYPTTRPTR